MSFQTPVSVRDILAGIHHKEYLLPAIQREFVWDGDQVRRLVDSLMRGYPIGSFLVWKVEAATAAGYTFYDFLTNYHERDHPYATKAVVPDGHAILAILDGQQRLTALNIAVYGSMAVKKKYAFWTNSGAFPAKQLYLNLVRAPDPEDLALAYDLRFLTPEEAETDSSSFNPWYPVGNIMGQVDGPEMLDAIVARGITDPSHVSAAHHRLWDLHKAFHTLKPINYYLESSQDPDKVLDIFVRVNSGGTTLSYSDLLLSMATNQWEHLDAREEVRNVVEKMNTGPRQFAFSKDVALKTALMVAGVDLRFRVSNFTQANMKQVEHVWEQTRNSLIRAVSLLGSFGLTGRTLTADSVVIPVAYYLARRRLTDSYLESMAAASDREVIQSWVIRSLVKRGIWGSGLDTLLARIRKVIDDHGQSRFPASELQHDMAVGGKSMTFDVTEIDELLAMKYGGQRTFPVLSLLYPGLDFTKEFHEDHIYPRSRFTTKRLLDAGIAPDLIGDYQDAVNLLPNLQLLSGVVNVEKLATPPDEWLADAFTSVEKRSTYLQSNDLDGIPLDLGSFLDFFRSRRERMRKRLLDLLAIADSSATSSDDFSLD
jgi:hypothetical protein